MEKSLWNSLEKVKIAISVITPLIVLILGIVINNSVKTSERSIGLRSEIYQEVGGDLNDIFSYTAFVGNWKDLSPADVIARKRSVDKAMYTYKPFFSKELFTTYERFMNESFSAYGGPGQDAQIRSEISSAAGDRREHSREPWKSSWDARFTLEPNNPAQQQAYGQFLEELARDLKL